MQIIIPIIRYIFLTIIAAISTTYFLSYLFQPIYELLFPSEIGGFGDIDFTGAALLFVALQFYIAAFFVAFGDRVRYWAYGMLFIVLLIIDYQIDSGRLPILLLIVLSGGMLGILARLISKNTLGRMSVFEPYKKYF